MVVEQYEALTMVVAALGKAGVVDPKKFRQALCDVVIQHINQEGGCTQEYQDALKEFALIVGYNASYVLDPDVDMTPPKDFGGKPLETPAETTQPPQKPPR